MSNFDTLRFGFRRFQMTSLAGADIGTLFLFLYVPDGMMDLAPSIVIAPSSHYAAMVRNHAPEKDRIECRRSDSVSHA